MSLLLENQPSPLPIELPSLYTAAVASEPDSKLRNSISFRVHSASTRTMHMRISVTDIIISEEVGQTSHAAISAESASLFA